MVRKERSARLQRWGSGLDPPPQIGDRGSQGFSEARIWWNGLLTRACQQKSRQCRYSVNVTFRDHAALKLRTSHVFFTWLLTVILGGIYALS